MQTRPLYRWRGSDDFAEGAIANDLVFRWRRTWHCVCRLQTEATSKSVGSLWRRDLRGSWRDNRLASVAALPEPDGNEAYLAGERKNAEAAIRELAPRSPGITTYRELWTSVLSLHAARLTEVNSICANMRKSGELVFPNWEDRARVPKNHFKLHRSQ
jgi:hypothetical protein